MFFPSCNMVAKLTDCLDMQGAYCRLILLVLRPWLCRLAALQLLGKPLSPLTLLNPALLGV